MRTILGISIASVIAVTVWWTFPTKAKQQIDTVSIDPLSMMTTVTKCPSPRNTIMVFFNTTSKS